MKVLKIMVADGKLIRDPKTANRLRAGQCYTVPAVQYWLKRLNDGDVVPYKEKPKAKPKYKPLKVEKTKEEKVETNEMGVLNDN